MGPMGPRGHGPIKHNLFVSPCRFPNDMLGFWSCKNPFVSPCRFPNDILGFWKSESSKS